MHILRSSVPRESGPRLNVHSWWHTASDLESFEGAEGRASQIAMWAFWTWISSSKGWRLWWKYMRQWFRSVAVGLVMSLLFWPVVALIWKTLVQSSLCWDFVVSTLLHVSLGPAHHSLCVQPCLCVDVCVSLLWEWPDGFYPVFPSSEDKGDVEMNERMNRLRMRIESNLKC